MKSNFLESAANAEPLVLVVDDTPVNLQLAGNILQKRGYDLAFAMNGREAIETAREEHPDAILLDVMMPEMDGYEVCRQLKADAATRDIPIIFLTAKAEESDIVKAFEVGGVDYVTKPFRTEELVARLSTHLKLVRTSRRNRELSARMAHLLGVAAHDLKNPLAGIKGFAEELIEAEQGDSGISLDTQERLESLQTILLAANHMLEIVHGLVDTVSLESGKSEAKLERINLAEVCRLAHKINSSHATEKQITLLTEFPAELTVHADKRMAMEIIDNLVSNAVKYSPLGKRVWLTLTENGNEVLLSVKDEGPGFTEKDMTKIFGRFEKLSARPTGGECSTGLGLSITREMVELNRGRIWVESEPGQGATFQVEFPKESGE